MAKETKETFSGKLKDQTFEVFDEKVLTWCRKLFGDYYARELWHNELQKLDYLDLNEDEDSFTFEMHCARVYDVLAIKSPKEADHLFQSDRFWTKNGSWSSGNVVASEYSATSKKPAAEKQQGS
jgi:hypothetical protein